MFRRLRNKLILINLGITTLVIVVVFTTIYVISTKTAENRPLKFPEMPINLENTGETPEEIPDDWQNLIVLNVKQEKESAAQNLLVTLISSGIAIEIVVALISYFMAEEAIKPVKEAYEAQKVFIANASHEIKTPLAAISANLEAADIEGNKWISNVEIETAKLTNLNNELLKLARTDLMKAGVTEEVELGTLINRILDRFEPRLKSKKLVRKINLDRKVKVNLADFEQILSILMDNAVKYSDKKIVVELDEHSLRISNDGAKIPADKITHVFDRFYQVNKSTEGVGLGLSIAKSLADKNHYKLTVKSEKLTTFLLDF
ncbi:HAMP domain-containing histidine kinase [Candidatus Saccharibacteria bacterium]|nr:HAMP domain-containing histidine kinase [Candidatus Saccharibacteria bacterium]